MTATQQYELNEREPLLIQGTPEGWWRPQNAAKRHYFTRIASPQKTTLYESTCGAYTTGYAGSKSFKDGPNDSPNNCKKCQRKRLKQLSDAQAPSR